MTETRSKEGTVDRAGKKATPLTHDELQAVFEVVSAGEDAEATRRRLPN
ncbi:MAG: hypothetical protein IIC82_04495 [Chloroflexi bacterium]|nr:hypothetical protein [Chloroflexota bacterium]